MLVELTVENLAVVEKLRLRFHSGFNVLTGETGSGKSLVVDALGLLLGARASSEMIRSGAERMFVSGIFELPDEARLRSLLDEAGIDVEDDELLIEREVTGSGKSRAWAGSKPVTAAFLRDLAPWLGDIHGQHDQQRLFSADAQRELLDEAAAAGAGLQKVRAAWSAWREALRELEALDRTAAERLRMADLWNMQKREIDSLSLEPGEDAQLENERRVLKNVARLSENASVASEALSEAETSAIARIAQALKRVEDLARIDENAAGMAEMLRAAQISVQEVARELAHYLSGLEGDPARLEHVESRLARIEKLKKKYGTSIEEILAFLAEVDRNLAGVDLSGERRKELDARAMACEEAYRKAAIELRALRAKASKKLEKEVAAELGALAMRGAKFSVALRDTEPSEHGMDSVEFLISANAGEDLRPLDKVASGGEISRVALALKTCIAVRPAAGRRTLVFDEVDAGIGGSAGETVGRRLKSLAAANQVLCVTHLAQIASFGDHHYVVSKREANGRTLAEAVEIGAPARIAEIARMLSGQKTTAEALRHAEKLIAESRK